MQIKKIKRSFFIIRNDNPIIDNIDNIKSHLNNIKRSRGYKIWIMLFGKIF